MRPGRKADAGRRPEACRRRKPAHQLAVDDDRTGADEADAAHHLCSDTAGVEPHACMHQDIGEAVLRHDHYQRTAQRNQEMGAETRILDPVFAVEADHRAAKACHAQAYDKIPLHLHRPAVFDLPIQIYGKLSGSANRPGAQAADSPRRFPAIIAQRE